MNKSTTLKDIAKELEVSVTTVSKAIHNHPDISDSRRKQILSLVKKMQYVPNSIAQSLRTRKSKFIGLIISDNTNPYYSMLIQGVEREISSRNFYTIIFNNNEDVDKELGFISELRSLNVAGIIITPALNDEKSVAILRKYHIPFVLANRYINREEDSYVIADDIKAAYLVSDYLIKNRSKNLIYINGYEEISSARDRKQGYINALQDNKINILIENIYNGVINQAGGYQITKDILKRHKLPFSILCYSDYVASGVIKGLSENGIKIPEEVAVAGIDNIELFSFSHPSLTTVDIPKSQIGSECVKILFNLMKDRNYKKNRIVFEPKLIIRESA